MIDPKVSTSCAESGFCKHHNEESRASQGDGMIRNHYLAEGLMGVVGRH